MRKKTLPMKNANLLRLRKHVQLNMLYAKKAFGKNSTKKDKDQFRQAVKKHNYLKKLDESKNKQNISRHHESLYRKKLSQVYKKMHQCILHQREG